MRRPAILLHALTFLAIASPALASAQTFTRAIGVFNIFVGLMLTVAILTFGTGFVVWIVRLGTWPTYRTEAVKIMEWAVAILFVLVILLGIVQFFQYHPHAAVYVASFIVIVLILAAVIYVMTHSGGEKEEH